MKDLAILIPDTPGALADMGQALGRAGVSIEGGAAFVVDGRGIAHFLFENGSLARTALEQAGFDVLKENEVVLQRLKQDEPGQLGRLCRELGQMGVNVEVLYSDHEHRLVLVVDKPDVAQKVAERWR